MRRAERVQIGCALLVIAGGIMTWAAGVFLRSSETHRESPELTLVLASIPAVCLGITGIALLVTSHWFQHK